MTSSSDFSWYILQDDCSQYMKLAFLTSSILNWLPIFEFHHIDFWIKLNKLSSIVYTNCWEQWFQAKHLLKLFNQILPKVPFWFTLENKKTPWVFLCFQGNQRGTFRRNEFKGICIRKCSPFKSNYISRK